MFYSVTDTLFCLQFLVGEGVHGGVPSTAKVILRQESCGVECPRGRVVDSGPRGPGFNPQPWRLSLWP